MSFGMFFVMKPSYEELEAKLTATEAKLEETQRLLKMAVERIVALEERLNKNSKNSSKPPSSDQKSNTPDQNKQLKNRGHGAKRALLPPEEVDHFHTCKLTHCPCCGSNELMEQGNPLVLQQVELPEVKAVVTQYNCVKYRCASCKEGCFADLPNGVPNTVFGPRLMALAATLTGVFHLAKRDVIRLLGDLYGAKISEGSIINIEERVGIALGAVYERIHAHVMGSILPKHFDETSWRNKGRNHWAWVASTSNASCYSIETSRSKEAFQRFTRTLVQAPVVTDRYGAYTHLEGPHQYCLAHLIRDFRKYAEREGPDKGIGQVLERELQQICRVQREFREKRISQRSRDIKFRHQKMRLEEHLLDGLANGTDELSALCNRLLDKMDKLWTFSKFTNVDPTNNLAERDLRRLVLWRKKSYGTRSARGERFVERMTTVAETVRKGGNNILNFITKAVLAFYKGEATPSISPCFSF